MTTNAVKRHAQRAVAAGAVGAATIGAFLLPAAPASAQPVTIPGVGTFEVPNEVPVPPGLPGLELPGPAPLPFVAPKSSGDIALDAALSKVGSPYVYGAAGPNAFDCSGLVQWSYRQAGVELPAPAARSSPRAARCPWTICGRATSSPSTAAATPASTPVTATSCTRPLPASP